MSIDKSANRNLLHIIPYAYLGGTEKDCLYFIRADVKSKHTIWLLDDEGPMVEQWLEAGADVLILKILNQRPTLFIKSLHEYSLTQQFDAILYWSTIRLPYVRYALRNQKCRLAVHAGNPANPHFFTMFRQMLEHVYFYSDIETCLFACSNYVKRSLGIHPYYRNFPIRVSYNPVKLLETNPYVPRQFRCNDKIILGMTARLDPIKDHETLLRAFSILLNKFPECELWLMGDGILRKKLELLAKKLNIESHVIFWGNVNNVYEKLQKLDIFVYSTTEKEGLGNAVSEAMANGLPCVISNLPMMQEIAGNDQTVLFATMGNPVDVANEIVKLVTDYQLRAKLSENAFNRAKQMFNATKYVSDRLSFLLND